MNGSVVEQKVSKGRQCQGEKTFFSVQFSVSLRACKLNRKRLVSKKKKTDLITYVGRGVHEASVTQGGGWILGFLYHRLRGWGGTKGHFWENNCSFWKINGLTGEEMGDTVVQVATHLWVVLCLWKRLELLSGRGINGNWVLGESSALSRWRFQECKCPTIQIILISVAYFGWQVLFRVLILPVLCLGLCNSFISLALNLSSYCNLSPPPQPMLLFKGWSQGVGLDSGPH